MKSLVDTKDFFNDGGAHTDLHYYKKYIVATRPFFPIVTALVVLLLHRLVVQVQ
jgi:hypothetical protein